MVVVVGAGHAEALYSYCANSDFLREARRSVGLASQVVGLCGSFLVGFMLVETWRFYVSDAEDDLWAKAVRRRAVHQSTFTPVGFVDNFVVSAAVCAPALHVCPAAQRQVFSPNKTSEAASL